MFFWCSEDLSPLARAVELVEDSGAPQTLAPEIGPALSRLTGESVDSYESLTALADELNEAENIFAECHHDDDELIHHGTVEVDLAALAAVDDGEAAFTKLKEFVACAEAAATCDVTRKRRNKNEPRLARGMKKAEAAFLERLAEWQEDEDEDEDEDDEDDEENEDEDEDEDDEVDVDFDTAHDP